MRDLLDLARLNQRTFAVTPQPVDLAQLVHEAPAATRPRRAASACRSSPRHAHPRLATADPDRVLQVLSNLIENALRSTPTAGVSPSRRRPAS